MRPVFNLRLLSLYSGSFILGLTLLSACIQPEKASDSLQVAFQNDFLIGTAFNESQILGRDSLSAQLMKKHFNAITPENCMKWEKIHPEPGRYDFELADRFVELGMENRMHMTGHVLVWHSQTPGWVFLDDDGNLATRDTLLMRMREHIHTVVGRYRGRIESWDVVNEAIEDDGTIRNSLWYRIIGEDFIEKAFTYAKEADPEAQLIYNDYSMHNPGRREGVVRMVKALQNAGVTVDGIGMQAHYRLNEPSLEDIGASITAFCQLGVKVMITELDITVLPVPEDYIGADVSKRFEMDEWLDPYTEGLPDSVQNVLASRYRDLFTLFNDHSECIERVTFWGVHDGISWKNNWPVPGRTNYPLLFDREGKPKPAFRAVIRIASEN